MALLYAATLVLGAGLLFVVEPMMGKVLLAGLGGAPEVWITTQLFFQMALLAGYVYAHASVARLTFRRQASLHVGLLALALVLVPIGVRPGGPGEGEHPVLWVLGTLTVTVGLPFLLISANAVLLQRWIAGPRHQARSDPYFLYAASNFGSIVGLLAYPVVVEPELSLEAQARVWGWGYRALLIMACACAAVIWRSRSRRPGVTFEPALGSPGASTMSSQAGAGGEQPAVAWTGSLSWATRGRWLALAFVPSSFMLGTTAFITRDLAAVPLLWVIPLALYLGSLVIAFAPRGNPVRLVGVTRLVLPAVVIGLVYTMTIGSQRPLWFLLALHLVGLLVAALMCHGALAGHRPPVGHLTEFYLWIALGGALGGAFNALVAPLLFPSLTEYPLAIVAACLLRPTPLRARPGILEMLGADARVGRLVDLTLPAVFGLVLAAALRATDVGGGDAVARRSVIIGFAAGLSVNFARRPIRFAAAVAAIFLATSLVTGGGVPVLTRERTFFGIYEVRSEKDVRARAPLPTASTGYHSLYDGTTLHGAQRMGEAGRPVPLSYYNPSGPVGQVFAGLPDPGLADRTAVVGLGSGAMACYSRPGQQWTFYEIDPAIVRIAEDPRLFTYLRDCPGHFQVVVGDARRSLTLAGNARYGIIALDAFSSDAIPVHLLTRQALSIYLERLTPHGLLLFHISNRYLDLRPELGALALDQGLSCRVEHAFVSRAEADQRYAESTWVVMARRPTDLGRATVDRRWTDCPGRAGQGWTDDYSSLLPRLRWG